MKPTLVTLEDWPLWPERCSADVDLADWALTSNLTGKRILHMGTGTHHLVGRTLAERNLVLGLTCCPAEMESYMSWAVENPELSGRYQTIFGDLYKMETHLFARFDVITLFHLFERPDSRREEYGARTPQETLRELVTSALATGGCIISYRGSATAEAAEEAFNAERLTWGHDYRSLRFWKPIP